MAYPADIDVATLDDVVETVRTVLQEEQQRTREELRAFDAFADRVSGLQPNNGPAQTSPAAGPSGSGPAVAGTAVRTPAVDNRTAIRRAYEDTVMDTSFYETEYGDDYVASVREELGPEMAVAVTQPNCFSMAAKRALLANVAQARHERERLIETCERERDSIDEATPVLRSVAEELDSLSTAPLDRQRFGALDAHRTRLLTLGDRCGELAATRQETINQQRVRHELAVDEPDICAYLYKDIQPTYPLLLCCSKLARWAGELRERVERAMSHGA